MTPSRAASELCLSESRLWNFGGATADADGVWADITSAFILGPDALIMPGANPAMTGAADDL